MKELYELAARVAVILKARRETIAVAESSSGGLISAALLSVPGASAYYLGGGVVYTKKARDLLMAIPDADTKGIRSSSQPYAQLLARTARDRFGATWGISETGAAGPTGNRYGDKAGHTCVAIAGGAGAGGIEHVMTLETGSDDRASNMESFALAAMELLLRHLDGA